MKTEIIKVDPKEFGLESNQVTTIEQAFLPKIQEREALAEIYNGLITGEITPELCKQAKEVRLKLVKVRTGIADIHKSQKAFFLSAGRFVDAWKNKETLPVEQMEEKLSEIENYYVNIEKERVAKLSEQRKNEALQYTDYPAGELGLMSDFVYNAYLTGLKVAYDARIAAEKKAEEERIEAERKAALNSDRKAKTIRLVEYIDNYESVYFGDMSEGEFMEIVNIAIEKRTAKEDEQARIKSELESAKVEAERKEKEMAKERAKADAERKALEEKARAEAEKAAKEKAALEAELKAKADAEAAQLKAKQEAERLAKIEAEKAAKAPRKEKLTMWVDGFIIPTFEGDSVADEITDKFEAFKRWAKSEIEKL